MSKRKISYPMGISEAEPEMSKLSEGFTTEDAKNGYTQCPMSASNPMFHTTAAERREGRNERKELGYDF